MKQSSLKMIWQDRGAVRGFCSGVSLHSHTLHSEERLTFVYQLMDRLPWLRFLIQREMRRRGAIDFARAYWTPPLSAKEALDLEAEQIGALGLEPMVSLTDHDNLDGPMHLAVLDITAVPLSLEWTVPRENTFLHLGVHNLPPSCAQGLFQEMRQFTLAPCDGLLGALLERLHGQPEVLVVLNHPLWDENGIGASRHRAALTGFLSRYRRFLHALELNGLRTWEENQRVVAMSREVGLPVISGGDRHGREPNANVNLTRASTFEEFVAEVRSGLSRVLFLEQYRQPRSRRVLRTICDILRHEPGHGLGWVAWKDRVFYHCDDGTARPLSQLLARDPNVAAHFVKSMHWVDRALFSPKTRRARRAAGPLREEA